MNVSRRTRRSALTVLLALLAAPLLASVAPAGERAAADAAPLRVVGQLPVPKGGRAAGIAASVVAVDAPGRRLFYTYADPSNMLHVATYDIRPRIPRQIADGALVPTTNLVASSEYTASFDTKRQRLVFVTSNFDANGTTIVAQNPHLTVYNVRTNKVEGRWDLATLLPGFYPMGGTYSAKDDRLYYVGEFSESGILAAGVGTGKPAGTATAVVAVDPGSGRIIWTRPIPECQQALFSFGAGSLISRSAASDSVYFACVSGGTALGQTFPGESGVVRLHIDPKAADSAAAADRPIDFFPISGSYFRGGSATGIAAFDPGTDRFYLASISQKTPGAWVLDGRLSAWVGFVSSPSDSNYYIGVNPRLGHLYIGTNLGGTRQKTDGVLIADVRQTPVPAGEFYNLITSAMIATDSATNRLFVRPANQNEQYLVVEDLTQVTNGDTEIDWDADTTDTPESPAAEVSYALDAAGYGAQSIQVGGTGAPTTALSPGGFEIDGVKGKSRALMSARGSLDLRAGGAAAAAQAAQVDINTVQDYETQRPEGWPYPADACLDAGGDAKTTKYPKGAAQPGDGGTSSITCDLAKNHSSATATMGATGAGAATVQRGHYESDAVRTLKDGGIVTTTASADGSVFGVEGGYKVQFGRVVATARAQAHGRPGTTSAEWTRTVSGVQVVDVLGTVVAALPGCSSKVTARGGAKPVVTDSCATLAAAVNKLLPTKFRISFPMPEVTASPRGAYAAVEQTTADYFQQVVVNDQGVIYRGDSVGLRPVPAVVTEAYTDTSERSRTVTVLAATQASSIFTITPPYVYGDGDDNGGGGDDGDGGNGGDGTAPSIVPGTTTRNGTRVDDPTAVDGNQIGNVAGPGTQLRGFLFMRRSVRDSILLVLLSGLMLGGFGTFWRRRRLVDVLVTVPGKEAL